MSDYMKDSELAEVIKRATFYKVLGANGQSVHGGEFLWPLPDGEPGKWVEFNGDILLCRRGFHLTTNPYYWWDKLGVRLFIVEVDWSEPFEFAAGSMLNGDMAKVAVRRCLLRREATSTECATLGLMSEHYSHRTIATDRAKITGGSAFIIGSTNVVASGKASVNATAATVIATDKAQILARGTCIVHAFGETVVFACEGATVFAHDSARVFASGYSTVIVNSAYAKVWVAGAATAHIKDCASKHSTGCVIPSKKNPGRITYKGAAHSGINGDCWKVVKDSCERLTFKRR
jgi:hypothetical protein